MIYDIMNGGLRELRKELGNRTAKIRKIDDELSLAICERIIQIIKEEAKTIDYNDEMYLAVTMDNQIIKTEKGYRVINTNQASTYSEFGTGMVGSQNPHPNPMGWEYDVNEHGIKGWRYNVGGMWYFTRGVPSNPVYLRSAQRVRTEIPSMIKERFGDK